MKQNKILVIGDACVDQYISGLCIRLNPESPAPLLSQHHTETKMGMALNVSANIQALGTESLTLVPEQKSIKTRFIDQRTGQQLLRVDQDHIVEPLAVNNLAALMSHKFSIIVVSDYNKGYVSDELLEYLDQLDVTVFVDTKKTDLGRYRNLIFKLNNKERNSLKSFPDNLIVTLGDRGAEYCGRIYSTPNVPVNDVCGAGDMFLSALAVKYSQTGSIVDSINYANRAAGIAVQHTGVYVLTPQDLKVLNNAGFSKKF
jgi:D-beta-D-heptose 7-phosphate kinase/D-beta-D-heptose 1-phosphate adenosyltransferase